MHRRLFMSVMVAVAVIVWASVGAAALLLADVITGLPDEQAMRGVGVMAKATTIYDAHDRPAFALFKERRIEVPLARISRHLVDAVVAVEDQRFFDHAGVDVIRVAGAAWSNVRDGWGAQGGSTLTQQLARQSLLTRDKTVRRKLKEIVVAARLEREFTKEQILEWYLNKVYFGNGLYGVEAASLGYFGKHAADLDVSEAALLAGLIKAPSVYAPTVSVERAIARRHTTLDAMQRAGMIDAATARAADKADVQLDDALTSHETFGLYFKEEVRKQLVERFGVERVYEGGLQVYTTIDPDLQQAAEAEVLRSIAEIEKRQSRGAAATDRDEPLQAALVALEPSTGAVRAMVGGRSFDDSPFNRVTQASRQAGSAFKPFVYAAALERGYTPARLIRSLDQPIMTLEGAWLPDDHSTSPVVTMRTALRVSSNHAAVSTLQDVGIPAVLQAAERFGITSVPGVPSLALGSGEVTLLAMTSAYGAFANAGIRAEPLLIRRVESADGEVLWSEMPRAQRAVSEATAYLMTSMLSDVVNGGTAWQTRQLGMTRPAAGKTGTTNEYRDAWFIGYTPHLAAGVWVGYDQPRTIAARGYAATLAVPLWSRFMATATKRDKPTPFERPATVIGVTICRLSGKRATDACRNATDAGDGFGTPRSDAYTEYFTRGTEPTEYCEWHTYNAPGYIAASQGEQGVPQPAATAGSAPGPRTAAGAQPSPQRRGFWRRLFGLGPRESSPPRPAPSPTQER